MRIHLVEPYWFLVEPENQKRGRGYLQSPQRNVSELATIHKWNEWMMVTASTQIATLFISPVLPRSPRQTETAMALRGAMLPEGGVGQPRKSLREIRVPQKGLVWVEQGKGARSNTRVPGVQNKVSTDTINIQREEAIKGKPGRGQGFGGCPGQSTCHCKRR